MKCWSEIVNLLGGCWSNLLLAVSVINHGDVAIIAMKVSSLIFLEKNTKLMIYPKYFSLQQKITFWGIKITNEELQTQVSGVYDICNETQGSSVGGYYNCLIFEAV